MERNRYFQKRAMHQANIFMDNPLAYLFVDERGDDTGRDRNGGPSRSGTGTGNFAGVKVRRKGDSEDDNDDDESSNGTKGPSNGARSVAGTPPSLPNAGTAPISSVRVVRASDSGSPGPRVIPSAKKPPIEVVEISDTDDEELATPPSNSQAKLGPKSSAILKPNGVAVKDEEEEEVPETPDLAAIAPLVAPNVPTTLNEEEEAEEEDRSPTENGRFEVPDDVDRGSMDRDSRISEDEKRPTEAEKLAARKAKGKQKETASDAGSSRRISRGARPSTAGRKRRQPPSDSEGNGDVSGSESRRNNGTKKRKQATAASRRRQVDESDQEMDLDVPVAGPSRRVANKATKASKPAGVSQEQEPFLAGTEEDTLEMRQLKTRLYTTERDIQQLKKANGKLLDMVKRMMRENLRRWYYPVNASEKRDKGTREKQKDFSEEDDEESNSDEDEHEDEMGMSEREPYEDED